MIKSILIQGFKSFEDEFLPMKALTVLTGLNSSGKSTVMQALRMFKQGGQSSQSSLIQGYGDWAELRCVNSEAINIGVEDDDCENPIILGYTKDGKEVNMVPIGYLSKSIYLGADRFGPQQYIPVEYHDHISCHGENSVKIKELYAGKLVPEIMRHPDAEGDTLEYNIAEWMKIISPGVEFKTRLMPGTDLSLATFDEHRALNVGFGLSYAFPVILSLMVAAIDKSLVLIENPEAHLHPKGQTEIGRLIALAALAGAQVIIETHSDHLFDGIRLAVREHPELSDKAIGHWFSLNADRLTKVETYHFLPSGKLDYWPKDMFDQFEINAAKLL